MRRFLGLGCLAMVFWTSTLLAQGNNGNNGFNPSNLPVIAPPSNSGGDTVWGWELANATPPGSYLQGLASVIRAQGDYNLSTSAAAINLTTAARQSIENDKAYVEAYFAIRAFNRQAREAENARERQLTQEWLRFHPSVKPKRLTSSELDPVTGTINWPMLLQSDQLATLRMNIQNAFLERHKMGVMGHNNYRMLQQTTNLLLTQMLEKIEDFAPREYMQAKRFIEALMYEASVPLG